MPRRRDRINDLLGVSGVLRAGGIERPPPVGHGVGAFNVDLSHIVTGAIDAALIVRPDLIGEGITAGTLGEKVSVKPQGLDELIRGALGAATTQRVVWRDGDSEVIVHLDRTRTATLDGLVLVGVTVECDESGVQEVTVPFAVGSEGMTAGMLGVTESEPRGHPLLVKRWGEAIVAMAWRALLDVGQTLAAEAGTDEGAKPLVAGGFVAKPEGLEIITQAQHQFLKVDE